VGQLFDRIGRVIRAELNSSNSGYQKNYLNEGTALVAGGAIAGASIGKVGILADGTGYSLGAIPLAAAAALTGAALYEALRSLLENDASSASAAAIGGVAGAATSAAIGGVGVAVGGSAIGVGMASMAAGGAVVGLGLVGLNRLLQQGVDPEKLLDSAIEQMEADAKDAREAAIDAIASQKRLQDQYERAQAEVKQWEQRAQLALNKGDEYLAREALFCKRTHVGTLNSLETQLNQELPSVKSLKQNLTLLEAKISEAKTMKTTLKARMVANKVDGQLQSTAGRLETSSAMGAFERMEEKVLQMEARSKAIAELAGADLESQFAMLESGSDVDDELAAMKAQLLSPTQQFHSQSSSSERLNNFLRDTAVDAELEELKRQLDSL
jgi:phage shock protein A